MVLKVLLFGTIDSQKQESTVLLLKSVASRNFNSIFKATDANNKKAELNEGVCKVFKIGNETIVNTPIIYVNTLNFIQTQTKKIDGIIGANIINEYNWNFNF